MSDLIKISKEEYHFAVDCLEEDKRKYIDETVEGKMYYGHIIDDVIAAGVALELQKII